MPFKPLAPLATIAGVPVTVQLPLLGMALASWTASLFFHKERPAWGRIDLLPALLIAGAAASALLSPAGTKGTMAATARLALAVSCYYLFCGVFSIPERRRAAFRVLSACALLTAATGIWEVLGGETARGVLSAFKEQPTWFGNQVRAGGTFHYATIFAMYLEACLPFCAWTLGATGTALPLLGVLFSSSRTGAVTALATLGLLRFLAPESASLRTAWKTACIVTALFCLIFPERILLRVPMREEILSGSRPPAVGYGMAGPMPRLRAGQTARLRLLLTNESGRSWPLGTRLTRHWYAGPSDSHFLWENFTLGREVPAGGQITVGIPMRAPSEPGTYLLRYDVQLPSGRYLSELGANAPTHRFRVLESGELRFEDSVRDPLEQPSRPALWEAALRMFRAHPLLGVGTDGFRRLVPLYSDGRIRNPKSNANDLYLHLLAESGAVGIVLFALLLSTLLRRGWSAARAGTREPLILTASAAAWLVHGVLDHFLWYFPMACLFWAALGLLRASATGAGR